MPSPSKQSPVTPENIARAQRDLAEARGALRLTQDQVDEERRTRGYQSGLTALRAIRESVVKDCQDAVDALMDNFETVLDREKHRPYYVASLNKAEERCAASAQDFDRSYRAENPAYASVVEKAHHLTNWIASYCRQVAHLLEAGVENQSRQRRSRSR